MLYIMDKAWLVVLYLFLSLRTRRAPAPSPTPTPHAHRPRVGPSAMLCMLLEYEACGSMVLLLYGTVTTVVRVSCVVYCTYRVVLPLQKGRRPGRSFAFLRWYFPFSCALRQTCAVIYLSISVVFFLLLSSLCWLLLGVRVMRGFCSFPHIYIYIYPDIPRIYIYIPATV